VDSFFALLLLAPFLLVPAFMGAVLIWTVLRLRRAGTVPNLLLGGQIVWSFDELQGTRTSELVKSRLQVHVVQTPRGQEIGLILTQSGIGAWRKTGVALDLAAASSLIAHLTQGAERASTPS
jgi:hypothetical protein